MKSEIKISPAKDGITTIDINGIIGVSIEEYPDSRIEQADIQAMHSRNIAAIKRIRSAEIIVNIRSVGGETSYAFGIHDALKKSGAVVTTRCYGYVASAATIIAQAASPGCRELSKTGLYLIHNSIGSCEDELLAQVNEQIAEIYARHSGHPKQEFVALMAENSGNGKWLSPEEAIKHGLADRIIAKAK